MFQVALVAWGRRSRYRQGMLRLSGIFSFRFAATKLVERSIRLLGNQSKRKAAVSARLRCDWV